MTAPYFYFLPVLQPLNRYPDLTETNTSLFFCVCSQVRMEIRLPLQCLHCVISVLFLQLLSPKTVSIIFQPYAPSPPLYGVYSFYSQTQRRLLTQQVGEKNLFYRNSVESQAAKVDANNVIDVVDQFWGRQDCTHSYFLTLSCQQSDSVSSTSLKSLTERSYAAFKHLFVDKFIQLYYIYFIKKNTNYRSKICKLSQYIPLSLISHKSQRMVPQVFVNYFLQRKMKNLCYMATLSA